MFWLLSFIYLVLFEDGEARVLKNEAAHFMVDHQIARKRIGNARRKFEQVREHTIKDFESKKRSTILRTSKAVERMTLDAQKEEIEVRGEFDTAMSKIKVKKATANDLHELMRTLGDQKHPLE